MIDVYVYIIESNHIWIYIIHVYRHQTAAPEGVSRTVRTIGDIEPCKLEVKAKAPEPKQDIKPEVKKDEPKKGDTVKSQSAEPKQDTKQVGKPEIKKDEPTKAAPDELDTVKKNAGVEDPSDGLSKFSLKNGDIRFGMAEDDFKKISSGKLGDSYVFDVSNMVASSSIWNLFSNM